MAHVSYEQRIRCLLFYLSVAIFLVGLPLILSVALGYKFNYRKLQLTKTGLIVLKTQPPGAKIYCDNKLVTEKTPTTVNSLLPGIYNIRVELDKHYPWSNAVTVEAGKITRLEKIILFPLRPNIDRMDKEIIHGSWISLEENSIYYADKEERGIYISDLQGENYERIAYFLPISEPVLGWKLSPDYQKVLYFNTHQIGASYLKLHKEDGLDLPPFAINYEGDRIIDVFWHSDSYHIIVITSKNIGVIEARPNAGFISLMALNKNDTSAIYDIRTDTLYFFDAQQGADGNVYDNLYKLEVGPKTSPFKELIGRKANE